MTDTIVQDDPIKLQSKTIKLCSFLKTERINRSGILSKYKWTLFMMS
jgi:ribosome-associated protein YbcJ (S4-like RNA binding protein)